jgi:hypothetical protein
VRPAPAGTPILTASATVAPLLIDDMQITLGMREGTERIEFSNECLNIALCVWPIVHPKDSFVDLLFLIPPGAKERAKLEITIVYTNERVLAELMCDML